MLALRTLKRMDECFLLRKYEEDDPQSFDETVVDRGMEFLLQSVQSVPDTTLATLLQEYVLGAGRPDQPSALQVLAPPLAARLCPFLSAALVKVPHPARLPPAPQEEADAFVDAWAKRREALIKETRGAWVAQKHARSWTEVQRIVGVVATACRRGHDTFSALLAPPSNPVAKWQQSMLIFTAFMGMLTIDIWMYQTRANNCCVEARAILECYDLPPAPCRGFTGDCADLPAQFADTGPQNPFVDSAGIPYVCRQFPDPGRPTDKLIVSLIMVAVALPTRSIIGRLYEVSNQPVGLDEGLWLRKLGLIKLVVGSLSWHFADGSAKAWQKDLVKYDALDVAAAKTVARAVRKGARWLTRLVGWAPAQPAGVRSRPADPTDRGSREVARKRPRALQPRSRTDSAQHEKYRAFHLRLLRAHLSQPAASRRTALQADKADKGAAADVRMKVQGDGAAAAQEEPRVKDPPSQRTGFRPPPKRQPANPRLLAPPSRASLRVRRSLAASPAAEQEYLRNLASAAHQRNLCVLATLFVYCSWAIFLWCGRPGKRGVFVPVR